MRNRIVGVAIAGSASLVTSVGLSTSAQAASVWDAVAACESGGNWSIDTGNGYSGGLQFSSSTWSAYGGTRYAPTASRASKAAQIATAQRVLSSQGPGAWPTCGSRAGLTRANGGATVTVAPSRAKTVSRSTTRAPLAVPAKRTAAKPAAGKLAVDGVMGPMTTRAIQRWVGMPADGTFSQQTAKALQRKVGVTPDGAVGPITVRALQTKIGARHDGARRLTSPTVSRLQAYLNLH